MSRTNKNSAKSVVYNYLNDKVELGGVAEFHTIVQQSQFGIEVATLTLRQATGLSGAIKDSTINRYFETWIKANKHKF